MKLVFDSKDYQITFLSDNGNSDDDFLECDASDEVKKHICDADKKTNQNNNNNNSNEIKSQRNSDETKLKVKVDYYVF